MNEREHRTLTESALHGLAFFFRIFFLFDLRFEKSNSLIDF